VLQVLDELVRGGKIRHIGLSNESAWGTMTWLRLADELGLSRPVSIQNAYNLLNRSFEIDLAEVALREDCGLLAYSPLAAGTLAGKYLDGAMPPGSRRAIDHRPSRYARPNADAATRAYIELAHRHGLDPTQMALAFVNQQVFVTSTLIGATSMAHLRSNIDSIGIKLPAELLREIDALHEIVPNPCP
jgi:aryl-alcohol dehydrogenase-like predicted oxidoreductase